MARKREEENKEKKPRRRGERGTAEKLCPRPQTVVGGLVKLCRGSTSRKDEEVKKGPGGNQQHFKFHTAAASEGRRGLKVPFQSYFFSDQYF